MKGVIFSSVLLVGGLAAGAIDWPMVIADLEQDEAQKPVLKEVQERESLLREAKRNQYESLLLRQMRQLERFREQAERERARVEKLKEMEEQS